MKFVIQHMDDELYEWSLIEYRHISKIVGKENLVFTSIKNKKYANKLKPFGKVFLEKISEVDFNRICVMSQYAKKTLSEQDKGKFEYFIFGGILGDNPAKKRTEIITDDLKKHGIKFEERNLGDVQMPTDNAVYAAKKILDGKKLSDFKFIDKVEIEIGESESVELDFRYIIDNNRLVISDELVEYLRRRKEF